MATPVEVIQATLAPAFFISGTSIFLNFTQTRLFRVIDRMRALGGAGADATVRAGLVQRARVLRNAIALGVFTISLAVLTAILLMAEGAFGVAGAGRMAPPTFALAMATLFVALCLTLWDTVVSVRNAEREPPRPS